MSEPPHFSSLIIPSNSGGTLHNPLAECSAARIPLLNLSNVQARMDSLRAFLHHSVTTNTVLGKDQMDMVSSEIASAIHQIMVNGSALLFSTQPIANTNQILNPMATKALPPGKINFSGSELISDSNSRDFLVEAERKSDDWDIIELDAMELLEEHVHFCEYCGKGFKRDANLRMHMRAHGDQFKTREALAKPYKCVESSRKMRFSCPLVGCNRNKLHVKFKPLTSVICVRNHFRRSHCPKMYSCHRCNKKSFSVLTDLKSHMKHCGGTSFTRKDKLLQGHRVSAVEEECEKGKAMAAAAMTEDEEESPSETQIEMGQNSDCWESVGFFEGFGSIDNYCLQDLLDTAHKL